MPVSELYPIFKKPLHRGTQIDYNKNKRGGETNPPPPQTFQPHIMRKIEQAMNTAIANSTNWTSGNTTVHFNEEEQISIVRLHGNKIAEIGEGFIRLFDGGWQSNTTKSRLNAILQENGEPNDRVFAKNFDWYVSMNTAQGVSIVPFFSSMRLG